MALYHKRSFCWYLQLLSRVSPCVLKLLSIHRSLSSSPYVGVQPQPSFASAPLILLRLTAEERDSDVFHPISETTANRQKKLTCAPAATGRQTELLAGEVGLYWWATVSRYRTTVLRPESDHASLRRLTVGPPTQTFYSHGKYCNGPHT